MSKIKVKVEHHALDQCQVFVNEFCVAYVCCGEDMPINWLTEPCSGIKLTVSEKIAVARFIRSSMAKISKARNDQFAELQVLTGGAENDLECPCETIEGTIDTTESTKAETKHTK